MDAIEIDAFTQKNFPLIAAPHGGQLAKPQGDGTRYIVAKDGLYWELQTPWLYTVQPAGLPLGMFGINGRQTPYGELAAVVEMNVSNPPKQLWAEFLEHARAAMPNEAAALLVWNRMEGTWRLALRSATAASAVRIEYVNPQLADDEIAVIDVHSHGDLPAFFSQEDNADDAGGIKLSVVFGHIGKERPEIVSRLVCLDRFIPLRMNADGGFEVEGRLQ